MYCLEWLAANKEDVLYTQDDEQIERCVLNGKVVSFDGKAGSYIIGARQYFENGVFSTELWFDTSYFPELDANISNEFCNSFCQLTKQNILGLCIVAEIKFLRWGQRCVLIILNDWMRVSKKVTMLCAIGVRKPAGTKEQLP